MLTGKGEDLCPRPRCRLSERGQEAQRTGSSEFCDLAPPGASDLWLLLFVLLPTCDPIRCLGSHLGPVSGVPQPPRDPSVPGPGFPGGPSSGSSLTPRRGQPAGVVGGGWRSVLRLPWVRRLVVGWGGREEAVLQMDNRSQRVFLCDTSPHWHPVSARQGEAGRTSSVV